MSEQLYVLLYLSCKDSAEADRIAKALLDARLIACAKQLSISSKFWWKDKQETSNEVLLVMESALGLFDQVEAEVGKLHSYETFVLEAIPVVKVSKKAQAWMKENLNG